MIGHLADVAPSMYARVCPGLYVGNKSSSVDIDFISDHDVVVIFNLSGTDDAVVEDMDYHVCMIPNSELMDSEIPQVLNKLAGVARGIAAAVARGATTLVHCDDGLNKCLLAVGYYLVHHTGMRPADATAMLARIYPTVPAFWFASFRKILRMPIEKN